MGPLYGIGGFVLLALVLWDLAATILRVDGGGPLTRQVSTIAWGLLRRGRGRGLFSHKMLSFMSPLILMSLLGLWALLTWLGWTLIFCSDPHCVVFSEDLQPATATERLYYAGTCMTTLGLGDFRPNGTLYELLSAICGANGFFLISLSVAYLLPVYAAAVRKRATAMSIATLGPSPAGLLAGKWKEAGFRDRLMELSAEINAQAANHKAYPVLHFFHSPDPHHAFALKLAVLDEALTLLECGGQPEARLERSAFCPLRETILEYLRTVTDAHIEPAEAPPPIHPLQDLADLGVPVIDKKQYLEQVKKHANRRRILKGLVEGHGWE